MATTRWEYRVVGVTALDEAMLNEHGLDGWELVTVYDIGPLDTLVFKRRRSPKREQ